MVVGDSLSFLCGWGKYRIGKASRVLSGFAKREKVGTFDLSLLAVTLNFYDILSAPKFIYIYINGS